MSKLNRLATLVQKIQTTIPASLQSKAISLAFNVQVKMAGAAGISIEKLSHDSAVLHLRNRRRVQNHIGGIHAAGMALLAESATGAVFGMNVRDDSIPLLKSMHVDYLKVAKGDLRAEAKLTKEQKEQINSAEKGDVQVAVTVTDSSGVEPINAVMTWAWVPKVRKPKET